MVSVDIAGFDKVKGRCFILPLENFTFHHDPKESYQFVENGHAMTPLKNKEWVDFNHCSVVVFTHYQHIFMSKHHVKVDFA